MNHSEDEKSEIAILDEDPEVRATLSVVLARAGHNPICLADEVALFKLIRRRCPACIILEASLQRRSGLEILEDLLDYPAPVLMVSRHCNIPMAVAAIKRGAVDFVQKPFAGAEIVDRIEAIIGGASRRKTDKLMQSLSALNFPSRTPLSLRERDVLLQTISGLTSKESAIALGISYRTVESHRANIMRKVGVKNTPELISAVLNA